MHGVATYQGMRCPVAILAKVASPDYSQAAAIEGQTLRSEGNGPVSCSDPQAKFLEQTPGKNASAVPSTTDGIETVPLCAFAPPGSPLDLHSVVIFPGALNNAG